MQSSLAEIYWLIPAYLDYFRALFVVALAILLYSYAINYNFGHRTFWRKKGTQFHNRSITGFPAQVCFLTSRSSLPTVPAVTSAKTVRSCIHDFNDDVIVTVLCYLSVYDVSVACQTCRRLRILSSSALVWEGHMKRLNCFFIEACSSPLIDASTSDSLRVMWSQLAPPHNVEQRDEQGPRQRFFTSMDTAEQLLLLRHCPKIQSQHQSRTHPQPESVSRGRLVVHVRGELFDLTSFAHEHPGGPSVLEEVSGGDATRPFDLANHSITALDLMDSFLLWSPPALLGTPRKSSSTL